MPSSYALGDHFERFVRKQVAGGRYATASEVIREALLRVDSGWEWPENRLKLAIYLIVCSPEFAVQH